MQRFAFSLYGIGKAQAPRGSAFISDQKEKIREIVRSEMNYRDAGAVVIIGLGAFGFGLWQ